MKNIYLAVLIILCKFGFSQATLSNSLTACYALNANGNEPINVLTATINAAVTPTVDRNSNANSAYYFSGTNTSTIQLPANALIKPAAVSISMWAKTNLAGTIQIMAFAWNGCSAFHEGYQMALINVGSTYRLQAAKTLSTCSSQTSCNGITTTLTANTWYHFGAYLGPDSMKVYVNGVLDAAMASNQPLNYSNTNVILGGTGQNTNYPFNGSMDNVRFYNRKLTGTEFNQLYNLDPICQPQPVVTTSVQTTVCVNQPMPLSGFGTNSPTSYTWTMTGGTPATASTSNTSVSYSTPGTYTISFTASNQYGSSNTVVNTVTVNACLNVNENTAVSGLTIYPNPNRGEFFIQGLSSGNKIEVLDCLGRIVKTIVAENAKEEISLSSNSPGLYIVRCKLGDKVVISKIIKE